MVGKSGKRVFVIGLITYLCAQGFVVIPPIRHPRSPVEMDDAYTYMIKAAEMQSCFRQDCEALRDLRAQLTAPTEDPQLAWRRYREFSRAFIVYHPLHSALLLGIRALGLSWEEAYHALWALGWSVISLALAYWSYASCGAAAAGISLLLLAFSLFPQAGLHYIMPSELSLGVAMLTWGLIAAKGARAGWLALLCIAIMIALHPVGRLYSAVALAYLFFLHRRSIFPHRWTVLVSGALLIAFSFVLPRVVDHPVLLFGRDPDPAGWDLRQGLWNNVRDAAQIARLWAYSYGGPAVVLLLLSVGVLSMSAELRRRAIIMGALLVLLASASLFHILPRYPADLFARVWIPLAVLLTGVIGQSLGVWIRALPAWLRQCWAGSSAEGKTGGVTLNPRAASFILITTTLAAAYQFGIPRLRTSGTEWNLRRERFANFRGVVFDEAQPARAVGKGASCGSLLYESEELMHFFFLRGALQCGAVFYPAVKGSPEWDVWVEENNNLRSIVAWNPIRSITPLNRGFGIGLQEKVEIRSTVPLKTADFSIGLESPRGDATVEFRVGGEGRPPTPSTFRIPGGSATHWISLPGPATAGIFLLEPVAPTELILIKGVRVNPSDTLNWPWDRGISLAVSGSKAGEEPKIILFETTSLTLGVRSDPGSPPQVVADGGYSVLIQLGR